MYKLALKHSKKMAKGKVPFSHDGFSARVSKMKPYTSAAENVAYNYQEESGAKVVDQWENSSGHRANMLGDFTHSAVGCFQKKKEAVYCTQLFKHE
mmetsp:Transcript_3039/g.5127  ORF Transcript_3039/g.5127 Transcript_3039/m.5127 type:complete len:96 (-) Transcript_3039:67-354(-)